MGRCVKGAHGIEIMVTEISGLPQKYGYRSGRRQRWDCDNGSEFINHGLYQYCLKRDIIFTRSRPWKKNDNAHVEQKNGAVIRRLAGYGRYSSPASFRQLQKVYSLARLHTNFFQPVRIRLRRRRRAGTAPGRSAYTMRRRPPSSGWSEAVR